MSIRAQVTPTPDGAIVHDVARMGERADAAWFDPGHWAALGSPVATRGGRGSAHLVRTSAGVAVLRHYRRGGFVARFVADRYLWQGAERTRPFAEFRALLAMNESGLPAPAPLAARFVRSGPWYRADLLTLAIEDSRTLAQAVVEAPSSIDWARVGATIGRFHRAGWFHADLNAHNVLLRGTTCWLIDFDRGEQRPPAPAWQHANLARLHRSLDKLQAGQRIAGFERVAWPALCAAHAAEAGP
jgi:3-deoxy-D-manno-octulosonic acid kinase